MIRIIKTPIGHWWRHVALIKNIKPNFSQNCCFFGFVLFLCSCSYNHSILYPTYDKTKKIEPQKQFQLAPVTFSDLPGWKTDHHSEVLEAFSKSCRSILKKPLTANFGKKEEMGKIKDWVEICQSISLIKPGNNVEARYFFESRFQPYAFSNRRQSVGLFTGYYEPELQGSFRPNGIFKYPIYSVPEDLIKINLDEFNMDLPNKKLFGRLLSKKFVPYFNRKEIENGALFGKQLEILWVDNKIDLFFLHIQGSGRIILPDGTDVRIGYAGKNGHKYSSVGRELVARGIMSLDQVSMQAIKFWMDQNPLLAQSLMYKNKSFIFFRVLENDGPVGSSGVVLTPGRSIAIDPRYTPYGTPVWLSTSFPGEKAGKRLRRLFIAQDTGSAIQGAVRGDVYWGSGVDAGKKAGLMKNQGHYFILLPKVSKLKDSTIK